MPTTELDPVRLGRLIEKVEQQAQATADLNATIAELTRTLKGNGQVGLITRVTRLEDWKTIVCQETREEHETWKRILFPIISTATTAFLTVTAYVIVGHWAGILH